VLEEVLAVVEFFCFVNWFLTWLILAALYYYKRGEVNGIVLTPELNVLCVML